MIKGEAAEGSAASFWLFEASNTAVCRGLAPLRAEKRLALGFEGGLGGQAVGDAPARLGQCCKCLADLVEPATYLASAEQA